MKSEKELELTIDHKKLWKKRITVIFLQGGYFTLKVYLHKKQTNKLNDIIWSKNKWLTACLVRTCMQIVSEPKIATF